MIATGSQSACQASLSIMSWVNSKKDVSDEQQQLHKRILAAVLKQANASRQQWQQYKRVMDRLRFPLAPMPS